MESSYEVRLQALTDKNKGLENELENTTRRFTRKLDQLRLSANLQKEKIGEMEKDLRQRNEENEKLRIRIGLWSKFGNLKNIFYDF